MKTRQSILLLLVLLAGGTSHATEWVTSEQAGQVYAFVLYPELQRVARPGVAIVCNGKDPQVQVVFPGYVQGSAQYQLRIGAKSMSNREKLLVEDVRTSGNPSYSYKGDKAKEVAGVIFSNSGKVVTNGQDKFILPKNAHTAKQHLASCLGR